MKLRIGDIYTVDYADHWHAQRLRPSELDGAFMLRVRGKLIRADKREIVIEASTHLGDDQSDARGDHYGVLRSAITRIKRLGRET